VSALCQLTGLSRAGFYRWSAPRQGTPVEMELRDQLQKVALESPAYGYRRITAELQQRGFQVNHKRVLQNCKSCKKVKSMVVVQKRHNRRWQDNHLIAVSNGFQPASGKRKHFALSKAARVCDNKLTVRIRGLFENHPAAANERTGERKYAGH